MVRLKNIKVNDFCATCDAFVEDCDTPVFLKYDYKNQRLNDYKLPQGYEYCSSHIKHAQNYLETIINKENVPNDYTIMWY